MARARRRLVLGLAASLLATAAMAQGAGQTITATPLAPLPGVTGQPLVVTPGTQMVAPAVPSPAVPSPAVPSPAPPNTQPAPAPASAAPASPPGASTAPPAEAGAQPVFTPAPPIPEAWQPQGTAQLQVLDKIDAQASTLTIKVGQSVQYRALTIAVRACDASTKDEKQDATAFLDITDSHPDEPSFHGWMLKSDPSISMLQHPIYDVRVIGCSA